MTTQELFSTIAGIATFIENFPMSILDMMDGKVYTSIFDFLMDVLVACGVDVNEALDWLLRQIYGIEANIVSDLDAFYENIQSYASQLEEQNGFTQSLELSVKAILFTLLSSFFTCGAIPVLPNRVFDGANPDNFDGLDKTLLGILGLDLFEPFVIPAKVIDPMNILSVSPTSRDGQLFYSVEGGDIFYRREMVSILEASGDRLYPDENNVQMGITYEPPLDEYSEGEIRLLLQKAVSSDVKATISYTSYGGSVTRTWTTTIPAGATESNDTMLISSVDGLGQRSTISSVILNDESAEVAVGDYWVYLSSDASADFIAKWDDYPLWTMTWGSKNTDEAPDTYRDGYAYIQCERKDVPDTVERLTAMPSNITEESPEYIVCYEGLNPNTLYKTNDMNAFIWYALHKGMTAPQENRNHLMWDSRVGAALYDGVTRNSPEEWNEWYGSKTNYIDEFKYHGAPIVRKTPLYPIIQLEPQGMSENLLRIHIPSQKYLYPGIRDRVIDGEKRLWPSFNATIYKFNWDYLTNMRLFHPKLMLVGLVEYLLGFTLSSVGSIDISLTGRLIKGKISSAVKSVIEANDMEVEDCYTSFSNDEINDMLEETILYRYGASTYGGESRPVRTHDINDYLTTLDQVNPNTSREGTVTQVTKLVTDVTADPGSEDTLAFGQISVDNNLLSKFLWAITMPIVQQLFTPKLLLLIMINFELMGLTRLDSTLGQNLTWILNLIMNAVLGIIKSIVLFIKDKIIELLLRFFYNQIMPLLIRWKLLLILEQLNYWLMVITAAIKCLPLFKFERARIVSSIDEVNYADIVNDQTTPQAASTC